MFLLLLFMNFEVGAILRNYSEGIFTNYVVAMLIIIPNSGYPNSEHVHTCVCPNANEPTPTQANTQCIHTHEPNEHESKCMHKGKHNYTTPI